MTRVRSANPLLPRNTQRLFAALMLAATLLTALPLYGLLLVEWGLGQRQSASGALIFLPDGVARDASDRLLLQLRSELAPASERSTTADVTVSLVPEDRQREAFARVIGTPPSDRPGNAITAGSVLLVRASGDAATDLLPRLTALLVTLAPQAALVALEGDDPSAGATAALDPLRQALLPLRLFLPLSFLAVLLFWAVASWIVVSLLLAQRRASVETLLLLGCGPRTLSRLLLSPLIRAALLGLLAGLGVAALALALLRARLAQVADPPLFLLWASDLPWHWLALGSGALLLLALAVVQLILRWRVRTYLAQ